MNTVDKETFIQMHRALKAAADHIIYMDTTDHYKYTFLDEMEKLDNLMKPVTITTEMVRELRELTGEGMMSCKKALYAARGDQEQSVIYLRAGHSLCI